MKKIFVLFLTAILCFSSCYDDAELQDRVDLLEKATKVTLKNSIATLTSRYNELDTQISLLEGEHSVSENKIKELKEQQKKIGERLDELKQWMEKLLEGYYTKEELDKQLESMNESIKSLNESIDGIKKQMEHLTREFKITFEDLGIGILPGETVKVNYKIEGATHETIVKALGQNGWYARVKQLTDSTGVISVTAPDPMVEDEIVVIVYDGQYRTIMSSIDFVHGVIVPSMEAVEMKKEAGRFDLSIDTNLEYEVVISDEDQTWLSLIPDSKSNRIDKLSFSVSENHGKLKREGSIVLKIGKHEKVVKVLQDGKNRIDLILSHNASVLGVPQWFGEAVEGLVKWNEGMEAVEYAQNLSYEYPSTEAKKASFEMYGVNGFKIDDVSEFSHLSILHD